MTVYKVLENQIKNNLVKSLNSYKEIVHAFRLENSQGGGYPDIFVHTKENIFGFEIKTGHQKPSARQGFFAKNCDKCYLLYFRKKYPAFHGETKKIVCVLTEEEAIKKILEIVNVN